MTEPRYYSLFSVKVDQWTCDAAVEYRRIATLTAFNIENSTKSTKMNQHSTRYTFPDGSILIINHTKRDAGLVDRIGRSALYELPLMINMRRD